MKKLGISLLIAIIMLFSTSAQSFYNSNNMPIIKMMTVMMEIMSRMMLGGNSMNSYAPMALAPMAGMSGLNGMNGLNGLNSLPMSPTNPLMSLYGNNSMLNSNTANPWQNMLGNNLLNQNGFNQTNNSMNGIWQALSGDVIAIYYSSKFIWTDGRKRHLVGTLMIKGNQLTAYMPSQKKVVNFQFFRENNKFAVKDSSGQIHIFTRIH